MNSERLMNEQRLALLKTIRKENPSLRRYMNDIINEMENPESAFNTGKMTQPTDLDRTTAMRLCDAFAVAKMYSEKYHLDFPELIEFVSEETVLLVKENKAMASGQFKKSIEYSIRKRYPFRNPLIARDELKNCKNYNRYDEIYDLEKIGTTDMDVSIHDSVLIEPMGNLTDSEYSRDTVESVTDHQIFADSIDKALTELDPIEEKVLRVRFGFEDGHPHTLDDTGKTFDLSGGRMWQIEAKAIRKLGSKRHFPWLRELLTGCEFYCTPVRKSPSIITPNNRDANVFHIFDCWKLYCNCGKRVQFGEAVKVGNRFCDIFYCQKCGRIYEIQNGKLKPILWYRLKEYESKSSLERE